MDIIKNPIILAVLAGTIAYLYLYYNKQSKEKSKESINLMYPGIVALITLVSSYLFFSSKTENVSPELQGGKNFSESVTDSFGSNTYKLIGKNNIKLPQTDVFIDLAHF